MAYKAVAKWILDFRSTMCDSKSFPNTPDVCRNIDNIAKQLVEDEFVDSASDAEAAEKALIKHVRKLRASTGGGDELFDLPKWAKNYVAENTASC